MAGHQLIIGGQRSGKTRQAERLGLAWLAQAADAPRRVSVLATAQALDAEMRQRIARHRAERPAAFATLEEPLHLVQALQQASTPEHLLIVDCLTLWLSNWLMPMEGRPRWSDWQAESARLFATLPALPGPVVFVANEVGLGVMPMGREVREYVDELGRLNQQVAQRCQDLTLMVAGQAWSRPVEKHKC